MGALSSCISDTTASRKQGAFYKAYKINDELGQKLLAVGIGKKQLFDLHEIFNAMDKDNSGEINILEFFNYIDLKRTRFSEKAFSVMDRDGSGEVDFIEFVLAVWNYCSFSRKSLVQFAFDLYDTDGSGEIERAEASHCVREIWGGEWEHNANAQKVMAKLETLMQSTANGRLTVPMFEDFSQRHPILLFPAFQLQTEIQHRVLGERFWQKAAKRRSQLDPRQINWKSFAQLQKNTRQSSQRFLQAVEDSLHDNVFEAAQPPPADAEAPPRKRSSIQNMLTKARSRKAKVFLEDHDSDRHDDEVLVSSSAGSKRTIVTTFETPQSGMTTTSPGGKKAKSSPSKRPPPVDTQTVSSPQAGQSPIHSRPDNMGSPTKRERGSPKKKHKSVAQPEKADLVVEDLSERHASIR